MIHTHQGISALGAFKTKALQVKISKAQPGLNLLAAEFIHLADLNETLTEVETNHLDHYCLTHQYCRLTQHSLVLLLFLD